MADHSWLDEHVELYAINALDDDEVERLERELAQEAEPVRSRYLREIGRTREALVEMTAVDATPRHPSCVRRCSRRFRPRCPRPTPSRQR
ncbi:hypothetical protein [Williamsia sp. DF01-3]|uniref:RskA family anti-sigma factor n=1 Tax=Williamsia sp. DF01-3 TaxID=2934157 RepID=UPI0035B24387